MSENKLLFMKWVESFEKGDTNMPFAEWKLFEEVIELGSKRKVK